MEDLYIVVGLGNPGPKYELTRHNMGFLVVDEISRRHGIKIKKLKHKALYGDGIINGARVLLVKPQTFMNLSGESVREIIEWYKIPTEKLIIIYDDIDIEPGKIRIRPKGSAGTHNGMKSIIYQLQTEDFPRVRIGIGKPPEGVELYDYVLGTFDLNEARVIEKSITLAADSVESIIADNIESAMNKYNS
ncbi:MAG TPA: aminoacyl-tRNA hydrolase [Clostridiaceae bacterium]|nr:aminoacyl-tRNA hydrolase [Clostridiaceae bacterium]